MERLTIKFPNGYLFKLPPANDKKAGEEYISKLSDKLGAYEDAEEQGLLLRLPCKVGTEVWKLEQQFWIDRKGCKDCIYFDNDGLGDYCDYCEDNCPACTKIIPTKFEIHMLEEIGKTIFLTKEEAEQALEQMKAGAV